MRAGVFSARTFKTISITNSRWRPRILAACSSLHQPHRHAATPATSKPASMHHACHVHAPSIAPCATSLYVACAPSLHGCASTASAAMTSILSAACSSTSSRLVRLKRFCWRLLRCSWAGGARGALPGGRSVHISGRLRSVSA